MKARVLADDPSGRWKRGEIGVILENDYLKYDYFLELPGTYVVQLQKETIGYRRYYFYAKEVELLK